jgi:F-type H+-transporting ATPase subunit a
MLHRLFVSFFLFIAILYSFPALAGSPAEETGEEKKFQPGDMIMHHILDAHDWHILDWKGHAVSIPLPIILFHEGAGLKVFMS